APEPGRTGACAVRPEGSPAPTAAQSGLDSLSGAYRTPESRAVSGQRETRSPWRQRTNRNRRSLWSLELRAPAAATSDASDVGLDDRPLPAGRPDSAEPPSVFSSKARANHTASPSQAWPLR